MKHESNMTVKGQVTIPKDIRDALGLKPGQKVRFEMDPDGNARIVKADAEVERARRISDFHERVGEARKLWKRPPELDRMTPVEYQRWLRGGGPEV